MSERLPSLTSDRSPFARSHAPKELRSEYWGVVPPVGVEPTRPKTLVPKTSVSAIPPGRLERKVKESNPQAITWPSFQDWLLATQRHLPSTSGRTRTCSLRFKRPLLDQLSFGGAGGKRPIGQDKSALAKRRGGLLPCGGRDAGSTPATSLRAGVAQRQSTYVHLFRLDLVKAFVRS